MKQSRTKWQRARRWLLGLVVVLILLIVSLPAWFPWMLKPLVAHYGLHYSTYGRQGYARFTLADVDGQWGQTRLKADRVQCELPTAWAWWALLSRTNGGHALFISNAVLTISTPTNAPTNGNLSTGSTYAVLNQIEQVSAVLQKYLPPSQLTNCVISVHSLRYAIPHARWQDGTLKGSVVASSLSGAVDAEISAKRRSLIDFALVWPARQTALQGQFRWKTNHWNLAGDLAWVTNHAELTASFSANDWWPQRAKLDAPYLGVPAGMLGLSGYPDPSLALTVEWFTNQFILQATGFARPLPSLSGRLPPLDATLGAHGSPDEVVLDQLQLNMPGLHAGLTNVIGIKRSGELLGDTAQLQVAVDLGKLPGTPLTGTVNGRLSLRLKTQDHPVAEFEVAGRSISGWGVQTRSVSARGEFDWPRVRLDNADVRLEDGSSLELFGNYDLSAQSVSNGYWRASGAFANVFNHVMSCQNIEGGGTVNGPLTNLVQSGWINLDKVRRAGMKPVELNAVWRAEGWLASLEKVELATTNSQLDLRGQLDLTGIKTGIVKGILRAAKLRRSGVKLYELTVPCAIDFRSTSSNGNANSWGLTVDSLNLQGNGKQLLVKADLDAPSRGIIRLNAKHVDLADFEDFVALDGSAIDLHQLDLVAHWSNGPVQFTLSGAASITTEAGDVISLLSKARTDEGLEIEELTVNGKFAAPVKIWGTLPLQIYPDRETGWLVVNTNADVDLQAEMQPGKPVVSWAMGSFATMSVSNPRLHVQTSGPLNRPTANISLNVDDVSWPATTNKGPRPELKQLRVAASITPKKVSVQKFSALLDGESIAAHGEWPVPPDFWSKLWSERTLPDVDWRQATGHLQLTNVQIAALSRYAPAVLAPEGRAQLDLSLEEGGKIRGELDLTNAVTRPLGQLSPLRDISARVRFNGAEAVLEGFRGMMGGQPIEASGRVQFPIGKPLSYQLKLQGSNVPLARSLNFLLRGDFNVELQSSNDLPTTLSGSVTLHDGLYMRYARDYLWSGPNRPKLHPPYFSLTNAIFADWRLNVSIHGDQFLRVRMPLFSGVTSVNLNVRGTLSQPVITGDGRINSGRIFFPFGTLNVTDGYASLAGNDPHGPTLQIRASGQTLNYDVQLEVNGPADGANVTFSSTPPLNSEEILLMLVAGETPENEYTFSTQAKAGQLVSFMGSDLFSRYSGSSGTEPHLIIRSGESISEEGKLTYTVEYRFTDHWSIIGEYDRFNAYNANLKWKILSR